MISIKHAVMDKSVFQPEVHGQSKDRSKSEGIWGRPELPEAYRKDKHSDRSQALHVTGIWANNQNDQLQEDMYNDLGFQFPEGPVKLIQRKHP